eukprot:3626346-Rhodomonas_salina.1
MTPQFEMTPPSDISDSPVVSRVPTRESRELIAQRGPHVTLYVDRLAQCASRNSLNVLHVCHSKGCSPVDVQLMNT